MRRLGYSELSQKHGKNGGKFSIPFLPAEALYQTHWGQNEEKFSTWALHATKLPFHKQPFREEAWERHVEPAQGRGVLPNGLSYLAKRLTSKD